MSHLPITHILLNKIVYKKSSRIKLTPCPDIANNTIVLRQTEGPTIFRTNINLSYVLVWHEEYRLSFQRCLLPPDSCASHGCCSTLATPFPLSVPSSAAKAHGAELSNPRYPQKQTTKIGKTTAELMTVKFALKLFCATRVVESRIQNLLQV